MNQDFSELERRPETGDYSVSKGNHVQQRVWGAELLFETIEHLECPEFFLANAAQSAPVLILSTPINEPPGHVFHKQHWSAQELRALLERYFICEYYHYTVGRGYQLGLDSAGMDVLAVCERR